MIAARVLDLARQRGWRIATAESCTGGMISAALTDIAGSSDVFDRGFVTYSNAAKIAMLGVSAQTLAELGRGIGSGRCGNGNRRIAAVRVLIWPFR